MEDLRIGSFGTMRFSLANELPFFEIEDYDNCRYIEFNGQKSTDLGLLMVGNTPLSLTSPKRTETTVPFIHGTLDISQLCNANNRYLGKMYFNNREITYNFMTLIPREWDSEAETYRFGASSPSPINGAWNIPTNQIFKYEQEEISKWVGHDHTSNPERVVDALHDSAFSELYKFEPRNEPYYTNARCTKLNFSKGELYRDYWILNVSITFVCDPFIMNIENYSRYLNGNVLTPVNYDGFSRRDIQYGSPFFADRRWVMVDATPVINRDLREVAIDKGNADGKINKSYPAGFPYYNDVMITYTFNKFFKTSYNGKRLGLNIMNGIIQAEIDGMLNQLYGWPAGDTITYPNGRLGDMEITTRNTLTLFDDYIPGGSIKLARCTDLSFTKKEFLEDAWVIEMIITFTGFPIEFSFL